MAVKTILFDLDGTLLPMDQDTFVKAYFSRLALKLEPHGYEKNSLINAVWAGTGAMIKNDGSKTNEAAFWDFFVSLFGEDSRKDEPKFDEFYRTDFQAIKDVCGFCEDAAKLIDKLKKQGFKLVLATNPIFPAVATKSRAAWAGLNIDDFDLYTTYENSSFCKPNLEYYREICTKLNLDPHECLMVGNDVSEDMIARKLGMKVFLLTDCLINKNNEDLSTYPNGNFNDLDEYIASLS